MKSAQGFTGDNMYVIVGAGGFLGSHLIKAVLEKTDEKILALARTGNVFSAESNRVTVMKGDLTDEAYISYVAEKIKNENLKVIYTAACHNIDYVAAHPDEAYHMNVTVPCEFLEKIGKTDSLLFTSSDTVYGEGGSYAFREEDELSPLSTYGRQKLEAEKVFIAHGGKALRLPLMFSESISPVKKHFCDTIRENLRNKIPTKLVTGAVRSTLDYGTVADIIIELSGIQNVPDVLNIAGEDPLSKYELGVLYARSVGADTSLIVPVESFGDPPVYDARRADSTVMSNEKLKKLLGREEIKIKL